MKVSIITASYNYENYIKETIESVLAQTISDWEMIIVDDGSKDNSVNVIKEYCKKDSRIKLYQHENGINKGLIETIKLGISKAESDWIVFLESDDTIVPNYLEEKLKIADKFENLDIIFNDLNLFGDKENIEKRKDYFEQVRKFLIKEYPSKMLKEFREADYNIISTFSVVMVKKSVIQQLDFNSPNKPYLDYYLWLQLAHDKNFFYIDKKLTNWRIHKGSYIGHTVSFKNSWDFEKKKFEFLYPKSSLLFKIKKLMPSYIKYLRKSFFTLYLKKVRLYFLAKFSNLRSAINE